MSSLKRYCCNFHILLWKNSPFLVSSPTRQTIESESVGLMGSSELLESHMSYTHLLKCGWKRNTESEEAFLRFRNSLWLQFMLLIYATSTTLICASLACWIYINLSHLQNSVLWKTRESAGHRSELSCPSCDDEAVQVTLNQLGPSNLAHRVTTFHDPLGLREWAGYRCDKKGGLSLSFKITRRATILGQYLVLYNYKPDTTRKSILAVFAPQQLVFGGTSKNKKNLMI